MITQRLILAAGGLLGFIGVAFGAFGAHGLKNILSPELLEVFKTGVFYQLIHSVVILVIGLSGRKGFFSGGLFLIAGVVLFSFSLFTYALSGQTFFAMITPAGGILFLTGWLLIIINSFKEVN